jgi:hypothetical protein
MKLEEHTTAELLAMSEELDAEIVRRELALIDSGRMPAWFEQTIAMIPAMTDGALSDLEAAIDKEIEQRPALHTPVDVVLTGAVHFSRKAGYLVLMPSTNGDGQFWIDDFDPPLGIPNTLGGDKVEFNPGIDAVTPYVRAPLPEDTWLRIVVTR